MNKVYVNAPNEGWILDRLKQEWDQDNPDIVVSDPSTADVIWLFADFAWNHIPINVLSSKKVLTTIHHIVPSKFGRAQVQEFHYRDQLTTKYHVPNEHTKAFIQQYTNKPITTIPYWANPKIWHRTGDRQELRKKHNVPVDAYVVGSFQRDTEGHDLISPKLEKGPDLLVDYLELIEELTMGAFTSSDHKWINGSLHVLLAGWRRQYVIDRLEHSGIDYTYIQQPSQETINELYQCLDLYPVASRYEGGPQALIEAGLLNVPVVSRDMGIARSVLPDKAINDDLWLAQPTVPHIEHLVLPCGYQPYRQLIASL